VMYVLGSFHASLCNSNISVWYFQAHTTLLFLFHTSLCNSNISVWYFQAHTSLLFLFRCMCLEVSYRNIRITERCMEEK
jgi:hypothetical protein